MTPEEIAARERFVSEKTGLWSEHQHTFCCLYCGTSHAGLFEKCSQCGKDYNKPLPFSTDPATSWMLLEWLWQNGYNIESTNEWIDIFKQDMDGYRYDKRSVNHDGTKHKLALLIAASDALGYKS